MFHPSEEKVYEKLNELNIAYERAEHPAVYTCGQADSYVPGHFGVRTKSLFLSNKKKTGFYLVVLEQDKSLNVKDFAKRVADKCLSFCSEERMLQKLGLTPGMVSVFGLLNNDERDVRVYLDDDIFKSEFVTFHPNINTVTINISVEDMMKFIKHMGYAASKMSFPVTGP